MKKRRPRLGSGADGEYSEQRTNICHTGDSPASPPSNNRSLFGVKFAEAPEYCSAITAKRLAQALAAVIERAAHVFAGNETRH
jgi:hypothetical protein